jgi:hypothetical protein
MLTLVDEHGANRIGECRGPAMQGATSRLPSFCAAWIMNLATTSSRLASSHLGPRVHIAASNAFPIPDRASDEKTPSPHVAPDRH